MAPIGRESNIARPPGSETITENPVHPRSGKRNRAGFGIRFKSSARRLGPEFGPDERRKGSILSTGTLYTPLKTKALRVSIVGC